MIDDIELEKYSDPVWATPEMEYTFPLSLNLFKNYDKVAFASKNKNLSQEMDQILYQKKKLQTIPLA